MTITQNKLINGMHIVKIHHNEHTTTCADTSRKIAYKKAMHSMLQIIKLTGIP